MRTFSFQLLSTYDNEPYKPDPREVTVEATDTMSAWNNLPKVPNGAYWAIIHKEA